MSDKKDDPREVLSLLNSLGFVGITAQQLKAFMKDLKMHRKIKERERQEWKDETKKKILLRQRELYREVLREHKLEATGFNDLTESTISSESSTFQDDSSYKVVTVKIRRVPRDKENEPEEASRSQAKKTSFTKSHTSWAQEFRQNNVKYDDNGYNTSSSSSVHESHARFSNSNNPSAGASTDSTKYISLEKPRKRATRSEENLKQSNLAPPKSPLKHKSSSDRPAADDTKNFKHGRSTAEGSDRVPTDPPASRSSVHSKTKSFIRPWRLQPEAHRSSMNTKSDPVALYQKYKEEWKQLALPGEENHAGVRWAVREKMLGIDPNPRWDVNAIGETSRDFRSYSCDYRSTLECNERKMFRRRSRKIRKIFLKSNSSTELFSKPVFIIDKRWLTSFKSISESILVNSKRFDTQGSILDLDITRRTRKFEKVEIRRDFESETCTLKHDFESREIRSEFSDARKTLGRLVDKLLKKDIRSYAEKYKLVEKCCCFLRADDL